MRDASEKNLLDKTRSVHTVGGEGGREGEARSVLELNDQSLPLDPIRKTSCATHSA